LLFDDGGQDLIEYALLAALIAVTAVVTWQQIAIALGVAYEAADTGVQNISACTPDPGGGGCP
jgi:Flp pilus assembly pilin Flp